MIWHEIWITDSGEGEAVEEEKAKDREDAYKYAIPQFAIHAGLDSLFTLFEIFHRKIERVQSPHIECCQCTSER